MQEFNKDILHWKDYDYVVINDKLEDCFKQINILIDSEVNKTSKRYETCDSIALWCIGLIRCFT